MKQAVKVFITGYVHGVGFRKFIKQNASKLQIAGFVRNAVGGVEALFCGEQEAIEQMIVLCRKGPMLSIVKNVKIMAHDTKEELTGFEIVMS